LRIVTVIGARPQFVKAAMVSRAIAEHNEASPGRTVSEMIVHTGQHFDRNMSEVFFDELRLPRPHHHLGIDSLPHGAMTGRIMESVEKLVTEALPEWMLVYGDTNSTLGAALAAVKLHVPVAHIEAGLRSFNMRMPEEINRIVVDRVSSVLFCPTETAVQNLRAEGVIDGIVLAGDVMYDATLAHRLLALKHCPLSRWSVADGEYVLCTIHRAENTDVPERFVQIWRGLKYIASTYRVVFPVHPRTRHRCGELIAQAERAGISIIEPVSYLEMMRLEMGARAIITDSGGVQKEAFFHEVPCLTVRDETEWVETVTLGWNILCGADHHRIREAWEALDALPRRPHIRPFGHGRAAQVIVEHLVRGPM
jgi:UDP-GlcNAc3NAcA epimerase